MTITYKRDSIGELESYADGVKTRYKIHNGHLDLSGHGSNFYLVTLDDNIVVLGPLSTCKQFVSDRIKMGSQKQYLGTIDRPCRGPLLGAAVIAGVLLTGSDERINELLGKIKRIQKS